jgi:hypothetical protein
MTRIKQILLAGAATTVLMASPALANDMYGSEPAELPIEGAVDLTPAGDPEATLQALGYSDIEPVEAEGDAAAEGTLYFNATNIDGNRVMVEFDAHSATVTGEQPAY